MAHITGHAGHGAFKDKIPAGCCHVEVSFR
jgi:hypothetical protein